MPAIPAVSISASCSALSGVWGRRAAIASQVSVAKRDAKISSRFIARLSAFFRRIQWSISPPEAATVIMRNAPATLLLKNRLALVQAASAVQIPEGTIKLTTSIGSRSLPKRSVRVDLTRCHPRAIVTMTAVARDPRIRKCPETLSELKRVWAAIPAPTAEIPVPMPSCRKSAGLLSRASLRSTNTLSSLLLEPLARTATPVPAAKTL